MESRIVITGGTGFIGSHLTENLLNQNKKIILIKRFFSDTWRINEFMDNPNLVTVDIDKINFSTIFDNYNIEGVIHLATYAQRSHNYEGVSKMIDSNIKFPSNLLEKVVNSSAKYFINTGSFSEYDLNQSPINEKSKIKPFNFYASSKLAFEEVLKFYQETYDLNALSLKLFTPYGSKDDENKITPYLIINSLKKEKILIKSASKELDLIFVEDVINAYKQAIINVKKFDNYESFNIGTGIPHKIPEILSIIENIIGTSVEKEFQNLENDKVWCSNEKAENLLNWKPQTTLEDGLKETINYYKKINIIKNI